MFSIEVLVAWNKLYPWKALPKIDRKICTPHWNPGPTDNTLNDYNK